MARRRSKASAGGGHQRRQNGAQRYRTASCHSGGLYETTHWQKALVTFSGPAKLCIDQRPASRRRRKVDTAANPATKQPTVSSLRA